MSRNNAGRIGGGKTTLDFESWLPVVRSDINKYGKCNIVYGNGEILEIFLREGLDPDKGPFNHFEIRQGTAQQGRRKLTCFIGHRFSPKIKRCIRTNLKYVLEPYGIDLRWSGQGMDAVGFFDNLLQQIEDCDFCIFDTREADKHPNVYIEAGIAYALKRPFILAYYLGNSRGIPSDLQHIINVPYRDYRQLTRYLYFNMPVFLKLTRLRTSKKR